MSFLERRKRKISAFLYRNGADYNLGIKQPWQYTMIKIVSATVFTLIAYRAAGMIPAILSGAAGFVLPYILITELNKSDNDSIFQDLKALYDTLRIQQSAGIYITNALLDCYLVVRNRRLKDALRKMSKSILAQKDIGKALEDFSDRFRNDYLDEFVIIIAQSVKTGQIVKTLQEINKQMVCIEENINQRYENKIERKMLAIEILLFLGILAMAIYGLAVSAFNEIYSI